MAPVNLYIENLIEDLIHYHNKFFKKYPQFDDLYESVNIICHALDGILKLMDIYKQPFDLECNIEPYYTRLHNQTKDVIGNSERLNPEETDVDVFWFNVMNDLVCILEVFEKDYISI